MTPTETFTMFDSMVAKHLGVPAIDPAHLPAVKDPRTVADEEMVLNEESGDMNAFQAGYDAGTADATKESTTLTADMDMVQVSMSPKDQAAFARFQASETGAAPGATAPAATATESAAERKLRAVLQRKHNKCANSTYKQFLDWGKKNYCRPSDKDLNWNLLPPVVKRIFEANDQFKAVIAPLVEELGTMLPPGAQHQEPLATGATGAARATGATEAEFLDSSAFAARAGPADRAYARSVARSNPTVGDATDDEMGKPMESAEDEDAAGTPAPVKVVPDSDTEPETEPETKVVPGSDTDSDTETEPESDPVVTVMPSRFDRPNSPNSSNSPKRKLSDSDGSTTGEESDAEEGESSSPARKAKTAGEYTGDRSPAYDPAGGTHPATPEPYGDGVRASPTYSPTYGSRSPTHSLPKVYDDDEDEGSEADSEFNDDDTYDETTEEENAFGDAWPATGN